MASSLHGGARTPPRVRVELQASLEVSGALASHHRLNTSAMRVTA